jgi:hypothetical protein
LKGALAAQKEYLNKELELELGQLGREHQTNQQLIQQFLSDDNDYNGNFSNSNGNDFEIDEIILAPQIHGNARALKKNSPRLQSHILMLETSRFQ